MSRPPNSLALSVDRATQALILVGGLGTRLRPVLAGAPKSLAPVEDEPFLALKLRDLAASGVREAILCVAHGAEAIKAELGDGRSLGVALHYSHEPGQLGTAGAVRWAAGRVTRTALVLNGDTHLPLDLRALVREHRGSGAAISMGLARVEDVTRFGQIDLDQRGKVTRFGEKTGAGGAGWINAGAYLMEPRVLKAIPRGEPCSLEYDVFPRWVAAGEVQGLRCPGQFFDIGTPEDYTAFQRWWAGRQGR